MTGREITQRRRSLADANLNLVCGWALSVVVQTDSGRGLEEKRKVCELIVTPEECLPWAANRI